MADINITGASSFGPFVLNDYLTDENNAFITTDDGALIDIITSNTAVALVTVSASSAVGEFTSAAAGAVLIIASSDVTVGEFTQIASSSESARIITGDSNVDNFVSEGAFAAIITGDTQSTVDEFSLDASSNGLLSAATAQTIDDYSAVSSVSIVVTAQSVSATEEFIGAADLRAGVAGTATNDISDFVFAGSAILRLNASANQQIDPFEQSASSLSIFNLNANQTIEPFVQSGEGFVEVQAIVTQPIAAFTQAAASTILIRATATPELDNLVSTGTARLPEPILSGNQTLSDFEQAATGSVEVTGSFAGTISEFTQVAIGSTSITGDGSSVFGEFVQTAQGAVLVEARANQTVAEFVLVASTSGTTRANAENTFDVFAITASATVVGRVQGISAVGSFDQSAHAVSVIGSTADQHVAPFGMAATGNVTITGAADQQIAPFVQDVSYDTVVKAVAAQQIGEFGLTSSVTAKGSIRAASSFGSFAQTASGKVYGELWAFTKIENFTTDLRAINIVSGLIPHSTHDIFQSTATARSTTHASANVDLQPFQQIGNLDVLARASLGSEIEPFEQAASAVRPPISAVSNTSLGEFISSSAAAIRVTGAASSSFGPFAQTTVIPVVVSGSASQTVDSFASIPKIISVARLDGAQTILPFIGEATAVSNVSVDTISAIDSFDGLGQGLVFVAGETNTVVDDFSQEIVLKVLVKSYAEKNFGDFSLRGFGSTYAIPRDFVIDPTLTLGAYTLPSSGGASFTIDVHSERMVEVLLRHQIGGQQSLSVRAWFSRYPGGERIPEYPEWSPEKKDPTITLYDGHLSPPSGIRIPVEPSRLFLNVVNLANSSNTITLKMGEKFGEHFPTSVPEFEMSASGSVVTHALARQLIPGFTRAAPVVRPATQLYPVSTTLVPYRKNIYRIGSGTSGSFPFRINGGYVKFKLAMYGAGQDSSLRAWISRAPSGDSVVSNPAHWSYWQPQRLAFDFVVYSDSLSPIPSGTVLIPLTDGEYYINVLNLVNRPNEFIFQLTDFH